MIPAILVLACLYVTVNAGILAVGAWMASTPRLPTPAENARRYSQEGGTW